MGHQAMPYRVAHWAYVVLLFLFNVWCGRWIATKIFRSGLLMTTARNFVRSLLGHQPFTSMCTSPILKSGLYLR